MALSSSSSLPSNNAALAGQAATPKVLFGEFSRFAVWAIHTRFGQLQWLVADAEVTDPVTGGPEIIRQAATKAEALAGLPL